MGPRRGADHASSRWRALEVTGRCWLSILRRTACTALFLLGGVSSFPCIDGADRTRVHPAGRSFSEQAAWEMPPDLPAEQRPPVRSATRGSRGWRRRRGARPGGTGAAPAASTRLSASRAACVARGFRIAGPPGRQSVLRKPAIRRPRRRAIAKPRRAPAVSICWGKGGRESFTGLPPVACLPERFTAAAPRSSRSKKTPGPFFRRSLFPRTDRGGEQCKGRAARSTRRARDDRAARRALARAALTACGPSG
jgi:hypothetical protein